MSALTFDQLPLSPNLQAIVKELGYAQMTPIQAQSIPVLLVGKDLIGQSKTGSGKTAAFSLPILQKIKLNREGRVAGYALQAIVLCPTRELCTQVVREIRKLGRKHIGLQVLMLSGGQPVGPQIHAIEKGVHIVVGTPGRVLDHLGRETLDLSQVKTVVLDEADRMLDMGFQEDMEIILRAIPPVRQMVFFSATFPKSIEDMSWRYQKDATRVTIVDETKAPNIRQWVYEVHPANKLKSLLQVIKEFKPESTIVFCNLKVTTSEVHRFLAQLEMSAGCLHGDLEQNERDRVMAKFRNRSVRVLVATDVAARGLDITDLDLVINFDLPAKTDVYVHRIGRTGRAGKAGIAVSLMMAKEAPKLAAIEKATGMHPEPWKPETIAEDLNELKNSIEQESKMMTIFIAAGRKNKMRPGDILGALTGETGALKGEDIGKIEIHDFFSYVAVAKSVAKIAFNALQNGRIKGKRIRVEWVK